MALPLNLFTVVALAVLFGIVATTAGDRDAQRVPEKVLVAAVALAVLVLFSLPF
jgi:hypothetical protein